MNTDPAKTLSFDPILPPAIAHKAETMGVTKARLDTLSLLLLGILAGAFISLGAAFATVVTAGSELPFGVSRLLGGLVFSTGLILVVIAGAELFTGNSLIVMAWASARIRTVELLRNWAIVFVGNFVGAVLTAAFVFFSGSYRFGNGVVGKKALAIAQAKLSLGFTEAVVLGILCNGLVCLAVWLTLSGRTTTDRILAVIFPITAFVAIGFEHCIANMYFVPIALFIVAGAPDAFWSSISTSPAAFESLGWIPFFTKSLVPVTLGNIVGGVVLVGGVYWVIYLRGDGLPRKRQREGEGAASSE